MSNVVAFSPSPPSLLDPFVGTWICDPMSVSRDRVARRALGEGGVRRLWGCGSIAALRQCLQDDAVLAEKYAALCASSPEGRLVIARRTLTFSRSAMPFMEAQTVTSAITRVIAAGRMIVVHNAPRPTVSGHALRRRGEWLMVSERYANRNALLFPPSPVYRYYRADQEVADADAASRVVALTAPRIA
ncbi:MAG TPA: hypothetical protein VKX28_23525 [Xanthobacteraceae bacterium]|nr:hypothetical protein [Xanthobacteraceae bacterium]